MANLQIENLSFSYGSGPQPAPAVNALSLHAARGEFICILGRSGCGKTTLLNLVGGLLHPATGTITINGAPVTAPGTDRAMVFQHYSLFPWMTAEGNICFAIRQANPGGLPRAAVKEEARRWLARVGLEGQAGQYPHQLSGGMQQRVALARALAMDADTLLLDEPFGALDAKTRADLQTLLLGLLRQQPGKTVLFVTHDIGEAIYLADRVLLMEEGRIAEDVPVPFPRPRRVEDIRATQDYAALRARLLGRLGHGRTHTATPEKAKAEAMHGAAG